MDFWSRLVAGTSLASSGNRAAANTPEKRLARFKREYSHLLQAWRNTPNVSKDEDAAESIRVSLQELTAILGDEARRPLPHPCITCASSQQVYLPIGKIATTSYNEGIIREGVALFATLIDSEEEDFLENDTFSKSLMNLLVRITGANSIRLGSDIEVEVVELAFNITTKIRLEPEILPAWFAAQHPHDQSENREQDLRAVFTGKTQKEDFPLFYLLLDYIHHEGRIGDFARTGLLYIIEAASNSLALEQWIVESDLATLMATGLGALYSQLSRKLVIDYPPDELPPILAFSDYCHPHATSEIVGSASLDYQGHMETFLSHLVFWQDVLNHCKSVEVKQTLLDHFQVIFLQQLLYPSLLESSDVDGGSSVAVMTYLRRILEVLDHPDMIHLILHYLLALPDMIPTSSGSKGSISAARKRKSMDLATMIASQTDLPSTPALFNLVDLIQGSLRSINQQTVTVTLQLISVIIRRHHRYAVTTLFRTSLVPNDGPRRTIGAHDIEVDLVLNMAGGLGGEDNFDSIYESHIHDCMSILENHACSISLIAPKTAGGTSKLPGAQASIPGTPRDVRSHTLRPEDPLLETILAILEAFFMNSIETNLSLTATIVDLASCGFMHIDGWILPDPSQYVYEEINDQDLHEASAVAFDVPGVPREKAQLQALEKARKPLDLETTSQTAFIKVLQNLVIQVGSCRKIIPRFDDLLRQRREAFQTTAAAQSIVEIHPTPPPSSLPSTPRNSSPHRPSAFDALAQRIFPDLPSRSNSPRGRKTQETQSSSLSGDYALATASISGRPPPALFQTPLDRPSRDSSSRRGHSGSPLRALNVSTKKGVPVSQAQAYAAVDQSILARRVGLSTLGAVSEENAEAIPFADMRASKNNPEVDNSEEQVETEVDVSTKALADTKRGAQKNDDKQVTVSHVLTNVMVLQDFLLELAALIQVRASLFTEVKII